MRVGVIRGDLPSPVLLADLESVSQWNPTTEPRGQERYISRPTTEEIEAALGNSVTGAGATLNGSNISGTLPLTIDGTNDDLKIRILATPTAFTTVLVPNAIYATLADLVVALNTVLAGTGVTARLNVAGNGVALEANLKGVSSYIENDTVAGGSVSNTALGLANGAVRTMPAASAYITACNPVLGVLDVRLATINAVGAGTNSNALAIVPSSRGFIAALQDAIAPQFIETPVALDSFLVGNMADLLSANFTPDSRRKPALATGPAISVVEDDGFTVFAATLPTLTTATLAGGNVTIAGTGLGNAERNETTVKFTGAISKTISQQVLEAAGGTVSDTSVYVPASLITGATLTTTLVRVKVRQRVSAAPGTALTP
jgi:hypothetical protein